MSDKRRATPTLTERRKAQTQLEISRCAAELFADAGASAVTAERIADAAGVSLRTFYRYFRTKEDAVAPMLVGGVSQWIDALGEAYASSASVSDALEQATRRALTADGPDEEERLHCTRGLLRTVHREPDLLSVWLRVQHDSEEALRVALTPLMGPAADPLTVRLVAASANVAMRIAVETWAATDAPASGPDGPAELAARSIRALLAP